MAVLLENKVLEVLYKVKSNKNIEYSLYGEVEKLIADLELDIKKKNAKSTGKGNLFKTMNQIIKWSCKNNKNTLINGAWESDGWIFVTDGHQIIRTRENIELPMVQFNKGDTPFDGHKLFKDYDLIDSYTTCDCLADLKTNLKLLKAKAKADGIRNPQFLHKIENGFNGVYVNLEFLINIMSAFGKNDDVKIYQTKCGYASPVFFVTENTHVMLLPVNPSSSYYGTSDRYIVVSAR